MVAGLNFKLWARPNGTTVAIPTPDADHPQYKSYPVLVAQRIERHKPTFYRAACMHSDLIVKANCFDQAIDRIAGFLIRELRAKQESSAPAQFPPAPDQTLMNWYISGESEGKDAEGCRWRLWRGSIVDEPRGKQQADGLIVRDFTFRGFTKEPDQIYQLWIDGLDTEFRPGLM